MQFISAILFLLSIAAFVCGMISMIKPIKILGIQNRNSASLVVSASVVAFILSLILMPVDDYVTPPDNTASEGSIKKSPSPEAIAAAETAIKNEPKVKDYLYQPGQAVQWQIGVLDDGTSRVGYAEYICLLLKEHDALEDDTHVRIVDVAKMAAGKNFRSASLGHVRCSDGASITP